MKYNCDTVRDLMPLCADGIASAASEELLQAHIAECESCAAEWQSIKEGGAVFPETVVPEETKQYAKTAKRVRKKHILALVGVALAVAAVIFGRTAYILFRYGGAKFTAEKAAVRYMEIASYTGGLYPSPYAAGRYDSLSGTSFAHEVLYTDPDGMNEALCFVRFTDPASGTEYLDAVETRKMWGLWFGAGSCGGIELPEEPGVYTVIKPVEHSMDVTSYFYVSDSAVYKLALTCGENTGENLTGLSTNGISTVTCVYRSGRGDASEMTGAALDMDGNVLYTMENGVWTHA